jgi:hypothetical protein
MKETDVAYFKLNSNICLEELMIWFLFEKLIVV